MTGLFLLPVRPFAPLLGLAAGALLLAACSEDAGSGGAASVKRMASDFGAYLGGAHAAATKDPQSAAALYLRAMRGAPENLRLVDRAMMALIEAGRVGEAVPLAERLAKADPASARANLIVAVGAIAKEDYVTARAALAKIPQNGAARLLVPLLQGWVEQGDGKTDEALKAFDRLDGVRAFRAYYLLHRGLLQEVAGRKDAAGKTLEEVFKGQTLPSLRLVQALAGYHARAGNKKRALEIIDVYLETSPESLAVQEMRKRLVDGRAPAPVTKNAKDGAGEGLLNVAGALAGARQHRRAVFVARLGRFLRPDDPTTAVILGEIFDTLGWNKEAVAVYGTVPRDSILSWEARRSAATNLAILKRIDDAAKILNQMAEERPARWDALLMLGHLYRSEKKFKEAAAAYDRAVARVKTPAKRHWRLFYARAIANERAKQWAKAEPDFLKSLELNPDEPNVMNYLAYSWVIRGENITKAKAMLVKAVRLRPNSGHIVDSLGWALYKLGDFKAAVGHLERAVELAPGEPEINDHLGDVYWRVGRLYEARFQWRRALSLNPEKEEIPKIQEKLKNGMKPFTPIQPKGQ